MKHLFWIHSHITFICAQAYIKANKIDCRDCVYILSRGYSLPIQDLNIKQYISPFDNLKKFNRATTFSLYKDYTAYNRYIKKISNNENFYIYFPHSRFEVFSLYLNHKLCSGFFYIEEGLSCLQEVHYNKYDQQKKCSKELRRRIFRKPLLFLVKNALYTYPFLFDNHKKYKGAIGFNDQSFFFLKNKKIVDYFSACAAESLNNKKDGSAFLLLDGLSEYGVITHENLESIINRVFDYFSEKKEYLSIRLKFHPDQAKGTRNAMLNLISSKYPSIVVQVVDDNVIIEDTFYTMNTDYYTIVSSLGYYAALVGRNSYSFVNYLKIFSLQEYTTYINAISRTEKQPILISTTC